MPKICQIGFDKIVFMCYIEAMDITIIKKAGLSESQAKCYLALIQTGSQTPTELAKITGENRTNTYAVLNKLVELNLVLKDETNKKISFSAAHPSNLEILAEKRRKILLKNEQDIKQNLSKLLDIYYSTNERPGTRTLDGISGIKEVYDDIIRTKSDVYTICTTADAENLGYDFLESAYIKRAKSGINTFAISTYNDNEFDSLINNIGNKQTLFRNIVNDSDYDAPVEINIYGNKAAFIAYRDSHMSTIIDSPAISDAMRQVIKLLSKTIIQD